jgi:hypothetical protein
MKRVLIILGLCASLVGCGSNCAMLLACGGSRAAKPVPTTQPTDVSMTCPDITAEVAKNEAATLDKRAEVRRAQDQRAINMAWGGTVAYNSSESGEAAEQEAWALERRNIHLRELAHDKDC